MPRRIVEVSRAIAPSVTQESVGVPVDPVVVVDHDGVGGLVAEDLRELLCGGVEWRRPERVRRFVRGVAEHAGVGEAEQVQRVHPQHLRGDLELVAAMQGERRGLVIGVRQGRRLVVGESELAAGGDHQYDAMARIGECQHRAAAEDRLVIRMCMHEDDGGHGPGP